MRVIVFFDLPTETLEDKQNYRQFRKTLIKNGFLMMQESVYCRMVLNQSAEKSVMDMLRKNKPPTGMVQALSVTEKQFAGMVYLTGQKSSETVDTDERVVVL